jgi:hypothetical protein
VLGVAKRPLPCAILMSQLKFGALWMNLDWRRRPNGNDSGSSGGWIKRRSICFRRLNPFSSEWRRCETTRPDFARSGLWPGARSQQSHKSSN